MSDLSGRTGKPVLRGIVRKRAGQELGAAGLAHRAPPPANCPAKTHRSPLRDRRPPAPRRGWCSRRRPRSVWACGPSVVAQRSSAGFHLPVVDGIGGRLDVHHKIPCCRVGKQLHVVAGDGATFAVAHHMRLGIAAGGACHEPVALVFLLLLQALDFAHRRFQPTRLVAVPHVAAPLPAVSRSSPSSSACAFSQRTCSRANSRCAASFSLRRKLLPPAFALIFVPSSVTRSNVISPSALIMPSTCTNRSSSAAL